jgi:aryl-alcohol dehydrogenase-like predicted oxidoreductase
MQAMLPMRRLGRAGPEITRVGFGGWAIAGGNWVLGLGPQNDSESMRAIRHAVACGINWIDTAPLYGLGHSEEVIGRALREIPTSERPMVFTKCGRIGDSTKPMTWPVTNLHPNSIRQECETSLRRLGVDAIDLYQFHWLDDTKTGTPLEESWGAVVRLIEDGKVVAAGVSNATVPELERLEAIRHVDSLQPPFSAVHREAAADLLGWCAENGTGVIVYSPMLSGLLTDRFSVERSAALGDDDWRRKMPEFQSPHLERNLDLRDALREVAKRHGVETGAVAIAWTLSWPPVTAAIVGARSPGQVDGWLPAANLRLSPEDLDHIAGAIERTGAGAGPARP